MSAQRQRQAGVPRANAGVTSTVQDGADGNLCTCCDPRNPLVLRPDLGTLPGGGVEFALCVLHDPEPTIYRNRGDGTFVQVPDLSLSPAGEIVDRAGQIVASVTGDRFQRLTTVDDDEPRERGGGEGPGLAPDRASRPRTVHVDLTQDDFYWP